MSWQTDNALSHITTDRLTSTPPTPRSPMEMYVYNAARFRKQYLAVAPQVVFARVELVQGDLMSDCHMWVHRLDKVIKVGRKLRYRWHCKGIPTRTQSVPQLVRLGL